MNMIQSVYSESEKQYVATVVAAALATSRQPISSKDLKELIIDVRRGFQADLGEDDEDEFKETPFPRSDTAFQTQKEPGLQPGRKLSDREIKNSVQHEAITCFEDGKPYRTLKAPLRRMGLTFEQYKAKWGLPYNYPAIAPEYSEQRKALAQQQGLGRGRT